MSGYMPAADVRMALATRGFSVVSALRKSRGETKGERPQQTKLSSSCDLQ